MPSHPLVRTVAKVPEHDELRSAVDQPAVDLHDAIDHQHDRRDALMAVTISAVALGVMLVSSLLIVVSAARG
jgi:hypothetical protein